MPNQHEIETNALESQAHASTYRLIDLTDPSSGGTVVAVNIDSRYFLATAAHVIPAGHKFKIVLRDSVENIHDVVARHVHPEADVGLLELDPRDALKFRGSFVPGNRMAAYANQEAEYNVTVIGYPGKLIQEVDQLCLSESDMLQVWLCSAFIFGSVALPLSEWPTSETPPVRGRDVFIAFSPEDSLFLQCSKTTTKAPIKIGAKAPDPAGMSGGGIWLLRSALVNGVSQPSALLHGIQFAAKQKSWMRGTLIDAWLEVVDRNYPDLKPDIEAIRRRPRSAPGT